MEGQKKPIYDKDGSADRKQAISFLIVLVVLILLILILGRPPGKGDLRLIPGGQEAFKCVFYVDGQPSETPPRRVISNNISPYFVDGQVIVSGPVQEINKVRDELAGQFQLEPLELCDMRYQGVKFGEAAPVVQSVFEPLRATTGVPPAPPPGRVWANQVAVLFQVDRAEVSNAIQAINAAGNGTGVFADPNYLTGPLAGSSCARPFEVGGSPFEVGGSAFELAGSPFEVGGSPFEVGGSPFEVGGSPFEVGGSRVGAPGQAKSDIFWKQWAFEKKAIVKGYSLNDDRIRVAVFDAIPEWGGCDCDCNCSQSYDHPVHTISQENPDEVIQDFMIRVFPTRQSNDLQPVKPGAMNLSEHGVFAAGLINAVTGVGEIDLYQVLNAAGCGDLATLNKALNDYRSRMQTEHDGGLQDVIVNLSLGVQQPENPENYQLPVDIYLLQQTLYDFTQEGAVIVAAAGNNSAGLPAPRTSDLPAAYPYVIGVAATNLEDQRACYSNTGHISAPGGDGGSFNGNWPDDEEIAQALNTAYSGKTCLPLAFTCKFDDPNCLLGLVSYSPGSATRYRFWSGTSFAAPLASGIAARLLDMGHRPADINQVIKGWVGLPAQAPSQESAEPNVIPPLSTLPTPTATP